METRIVTLIENHDGEHKALKSEHGVAFLIHYGDTTILFDTGQSDRFITNATQLREDLQSIDHVVMSHGHYDHTNGFPSLTKTITADFTLHVHRDFFDEKYATEGLSMTYLGPSWSKEWAEEQPFSVEYVEGTGAQLVPGVHIVTGFDHPHPLEVRNPRFVVRRPGKSDLEIDDFRDEISLVLETEQGLIVLVGCSHPGIMNMLDTVSARFSQPIYAVLGGTHLVEAKGARLSEALSYLSREASESLGFPIAPATKR
jgi:7,8-dihydropterin-6-yl-methyl-4-(beta-D-ribofuranosyl)aminobenzene 5'-phosphate synthase